MITYKQLTLAEIFEDCQNNFGNDKCRFLSLLDEAINLDKIVPVSLSLIDFIVYIQTTNMHKNSTKMYNYENCLSNFSASCSSTR